MPSQRRITRQTEQILLTFLENPNEERWGAEIAPRTALASGTLYPALIRLERFGWLSSRWEEVDRVEAKRPRRRLYRLTGEGERAAREVAARARDRDPLQWKLPGVQPA